MKKDTQEKIDNKVNIKKKILNIVNCLAIIAYLVVFYFIYIYYDLNIFELFFKISSFTLLIISIIVFEIAYKKDDESIGKNGIEILVVAIYSLLAKYLFKVFNINIQDYIKIGICFAILYYILKTVIIYTQENKKKLEELSDIKEIVKDKPIKKKSRRKNVNNQKD